MLHVKCRESEWKGSYTNWHHRHRPTCPHCNPILSWKEIQSLEDKQNIHHMYFFATSTGHLTLSFHHYFSIPTKVRFHDGWWYGVAVL
jgi:hypothetical protein